MSPYQAGDDEGPGKLRYLSNWAKNFAAVWYPFADVLRKMPLTLRDRPGVHGRQQKRLSVRSKLARATVTILWGTNCATSSYRRNRLLRELRLRSRTQNPLAVSERDPPRAKPRPIASCPKYSVAPRLILSATSNNFDHGPRRRRKNCVRALQLFVAARSFLFLPGGDPNGTTFCCKEPGAEPGKSGSSTAMSTPGQN